MIPYLQIPSIPLFGSFAIHPFGVLVATGILLGANLTIRRGKQLGLVEDNVRNMIFWTVLSGFIFAHVLDVVFYSTEEWGTKRLMSLIDPRSGLSSTGGFLGAVLGLLVWCRYYKQKALAYADALAFGLALGWVFGRLGCYVAHDHPGLSAPTSFFAVAYPCEFTPCAVVPGHYAITSSFSHVFPRHDLGFYEACFAALLSIGFLIANRFRPRAGFFVAMIAVFYGPVRFCLDFLRESPKYGGDLRRAGLTPAQYATLAITLVGIFLCVRVFRTPLEKKKK